MERAFQTLILAVLAAMVVAGCKTPTVNLATTEPIKVDIDMRLDVYQYSSTNAPKTGQVVVTKAPDSAQPPSTNATTSTNLLAKSELPNASSGSPETRRHNRQADIQKFKNDRMVGEGHDGLLFIVKENLPKDDSAHAIRTAVNAENQDRMDMMKKEADEQKVSLPTIQAQQGELWRNRSFKGEWIEVEKDGTWVKVEKEG
ncbi:hypothetical protein BH09VER1_BH09VER1_10830 [soil metagenome]